MFYIQKAHAFINSVKLTAINVENKKFIKFIYNDKTQQLIKINDLPQRWNIYFLDPAKKEIQVDITMIGEEYKNYFK